MNSTAPRETYMQAGSTGAAAALAPDVALETASPAAKRARASNFALAVAAALLFILPNALFASAMSLVPAAAAWAGCAAAFMTIWRFSPAFGGRLMARPIDAPVYVSCAALALGLCLLGGEGHFFYSNADWLMRDSVLADIVRRGFVIGYRDGGVDYFLRAPLGMYVLPAILGRPFGLGAAHMLMLAQNALLLSVILYFTALLVSGRKVLFFAVMLGFSGMEIIPALFALASEWLRSGEIVPLLQLDAWTNLFDYSSFVVLAFWTPNHALPGWWLAVLTLLYARREIDLALFIAFAACSLFWSPLALMGVAPFAALFGVEALLAGRALTRRNLLAAGGGFCLLPIALYLVQDAGSVPHGLMLNEPGFLGLYALFLMIEIPQAAAVVAGWEEVDARDRRIIGLAIALLLVIPFFKIGAFNDFVTRSSVPALFILAFAFADLAATPTRLPPKLCAAVIAIVLLSANTGLFELQRAFLPSYRISDCNLLVAASKEQPFIFPSNYLARMAAFPTWMRPPEEPFLTKEKRVCWPDHPLLEDERK